MITIKVNDKKTIYDFDYIIEVIPLNEDKVYQVGVCKECVERFIKEAEELINK